MWNGPRPVPAESGYRHTHVCPQKRTSCPMAEVRTSWWLNHTSGENKTSLKTPPRYSALYPASSWLWEFHNCFYRISVHICCFVPIPSIKVAGKRSMKAASSLNERPTPRRFANYHLQGHPGYKPTWYITKRIPRMPTIQDLPIWWLNTNIAGWVLAVFLERLHLGISQRMHHLGAPSKATTRSRHASCSSFGKLT